MSIQLLTLKPLALTGSTVFRRYPPEQVPIHVHVFPHSLFELEYGWWEYEALMVNSIWNEIIINFFSLFRIFSVGFWVSLGGFKIKLTLCEQKKGSSCSNDI